MIDEELILNIRDECPDPKTCDTCWDKIDAIRDGENHA